jgi:hypothetical protein
MKRIALAAALLIASLAAALAQGTVTRIGPITPGNCASFNSPNTIQDGGFPCPGSGQPLVLPNGTTATTQTLGDNTTKVATDQFVQTAVTNLPLPNTQIYVGNVSGVAVAVTMSNDCVIANTGVITCTKTNGVPFGTFATANAATPPAIGGTTPAAGAFSSLTDSGISGSTQCVQANSAGVLSGSGAACGGSILGSNNTWTGTNSFTADTYFGGRPWFDVLSTAHACAAADPTGVADSTVAIQCHINYIFSTFVGGTVFLPCGSYLISGGATGLLVKGGVALHGGGMSCVNLQVAVDSNVITFDSATCSRGAGAFDMFIIGFQNVSTTRDNVIIGTNCNPILRDDYIWFGRNAINTAGVDGLIQNVFACGYNTSVASTGANWYERDKFDTCGITSAVGWNQGLSPAKVENHFTDTDFSGSFSSQSMAINDTGTSRAITICTGCVFSSAIQVTNAVWTSFIGAEFAGGITFSVSNNTSITASLGIAAVTVTGAGTRHCDTSNFNITC